MRMLVKILKSVVNGDSLTVGGFHGVADNFANRPRTANGAESRRGDAN